MRKGFAAILVVGIVLAVLVLGITVYFKKTQQSPSISNQITIPNTFTPKQSPTPITQSDETANWKTYKNLEGNYSIQYPSGWALTVVERTSTSNNKGHIVIQSKTSENSQIPIDMGEGQIMIVPTASWGVGYKNVSEQDFFNPNNKFWLKGDVGGGGPGLTFLTPEEIRASGRKVMKQIQHPTTEYENANPKQITTNYYIWIGNSDNEVVRLSFTYDDRNPNKESLIQIFNQILSSFKFTN